MNLKRQSRFSSSLSKQVCSRLGCKWTSVSLSLPLMGHLPTSESSCIIYHNCLALLSRHSGPDVRSQLTLIWHDPHCFTGLNSSFSRVLSFFICVLLWKEQQVGGEDWPSDTCDQRRSVCGCSCACLLFWFCLLKKCKYLCLVSVITLWISVSYTPKVTKQRAETELYCCVFLFWRWEEERYPEGIKWKFLEHKGPVFAPPYEPLPENVKFYYDGELICTSSRLGREMNILGAFF